MDQLRGIRDVTDSVNAAVPPGTDPNRAADLRAARSRDIEQRCNATGPGLFCQVVTMYRGGQYKLYTFRRWTDVRLVFAPDDGITFFGGDPDNFTFPRHDLDVSFYRVYEDSAPLAATHHFRWSAKGASEGDLVFVIGNPGSTGRLNTMAQLEFLRDYQYPYQLDALARQIAVYKELSALSPDRAQALRNPLFSAENSQKATGGYQSGLLDPTLMARKQAWETAFRARVAADPALKRQYETAWTEITTINRELSALDGRRRFHAVVRRAAAQPRRPHRAVPGRDGEARLRAPRAVPRRQPRPVRARALLGDARRHRGRAAPAHQLARGDVPAPAGDDPCIAGARWPHRGRGEAMVRGRRSPRRTSVAR
jgi:hypothetical protein